MHRTRLILPALAVAGGLALAGCGSSGTAAKTPASAAPSGVVSGKTAVAIKGFAFSPAAVTVQVGTTVTWTQDDSTVHTVTDAGHFDSGTLAQGASWSHTFTTPGTYDYVCTIHPYMKGSITVVS